MKAAVSAIILATTLFCAMPAWACEKCRPLVQEGIHGAGFAQNMALMLLPLLIVFGVGAFLYFSDSIASLMVKSLAKRIRS